MRAVLSAVFVALLPNDTPALIKRVLASRASRSSINVARSHLLQQGRLCVCLSETRASAAVLARACTHMHSHTNHAPSHSHALPLSHTFTHTHTLTHAPHVPCAHGYRTRAHMHNSQWVYICFVVKLHCWSMSL